MKPVPSGAGLAVRRLRLARRDVSVLGGILLGEDHLASIHGVPDAMSDDPSPAIVTVAVVTTEARIAELDRFLDALAEELALERVD